VEKKSREILRNLLKGHREHWQYTDRGAVVKEAFFFLDTFTPFNFLVFS
jgi:hypothetical protein